MLGLNASVDDGCERNTGGIVLDDDETNLHCRREGAPHRASYASGRSSRGLLTLILYMQKKRSGVNARTR